VSYWPRLARAFGWGIDRLTGKPICGFGHVAQSLEVIFTTRIGERVMRRYFGSDVPNLLGEPLIDRTVLRFMTAVVAAIETIDPHSGLAAEPRFKLRKFDIARAQNAPERLRGGRLAIAMRGEYRPRGHLGDDTPERGEYTLWVGAGTQGGVLVLPGA
jgi:phage baseplate assembly protein W